MISESPESFAGVDEIVNGCAVNECSPPRQGADKNVLTQMPRDLGRNRDAYHVLLKQLEYGTVRSTVTEVGVTEGGEEGEDVNYCCGDEVVS